MPTQVDERVVSMKFDNADFEKRSRETLKSLQQLDNATSKMNGAKGLEGLAAAAKQVDLSPIEKQATSLQMKFSALQVVAITTLKRITNAAITAGTNIAKSLTIQPITTGFNEYELKMGSIQTIMAGTGESIETVNKYLEELNEYSDRTIYSFSDMTQNIGKFTNAGVKLDKAVAAIKGISNVAAVSGANANEASRAMYNFAQALSAGHVKLMDWKSIELANMATVEFKNQLLETAVGLGTVTKTADGMYKTLKGNVFSATKNFNEVLSDQWMTTEVLIETLSDYADETTEIGKKAYASAQDVKTFTMLLDTLKEAAQSGWAQTYELVVGNFEEAKTLWTSVNNVVSGIISESAKERNEMLKEWKELGGRDSAIKALGASWQALASIIKPVRDAFREIFPRATGEQLLEITEKFREFTESIKLSAESAYTLKVTVKALLLPFKALFVAAEIGVYSLLKLTSVIWKLIDAIISLPSKTVQVKDSLKEMLGDKRYEVASRALNKIITTLSAPFKALASAIENVWGILTGKDSEESTSLLTDLRNLLSPVKNTFLDGVVNLLATIAGIDLIPTEESIQNLGATTTSVLDNIGNKFEKIFSLFGKKTDTEGLTNAAEGLDSVYEATDNFADEGLVDRVKKTAGGIAGLLSGVGNSAMELVKKLTPAKILIFGFGVALVKSVANWSSVLGAFAGGITTISKGLGKGLTAALKGAGQAFKSFGGLLKSFRYSIAASGFAKLAIAIGVLTASLIAISMVDVERVKSAMKATLTLMGAMTAMAAALSLIEKFIAGGNLEGLMTKFAITIVAMSASILLLVKSVQTISSLDINAVGDGFFAITSLLAALLGSVFVLSKIDVNINKSSFAILTLAGAIVVMVKALAKLAAVDLSGVKDNFLYLIMIAGLIALLSQATKNIKISSAVGLTLLVIDYVAVAFALRLLAMFDMEKLLLGVVNFIPVLTAFAALAFVASKISNANATGILALLPMALGVVSLAGAIRMIGGIPIDVLAKGTVVVSMLLGLFALMVQFFKISKTETTAKMTANFIAMGLAIMALSISVKALGALDVTHIVKGLAAVSILMGLLTLLTLAASNAKGATGSVLALTVCVGVLSAALALLSLIPVNELIPTAGALGIVLISLSTSIGMLGALGGTFQSAIPAIIAMGVLIGAFTVCMFELNKIGKLEQSLAILAGMALITVGLGVFCSNVKKIPVADIWPTLGLLTAILAETGVAMWLLQGVPAEGCIEKAGALDIIMLGLSAAMVVMSELKATSDVKDTVIMLTAILVECAVVLGILGRMPEMAGLIEKASALSVLMLGLSAATVIMGYYKGAIGTAISGAVSMLVFLGIVAAIISALGVWATYWKDLGKTLDLGVEMLAKIGEGIGKFIGSIIGGFSEGMLSGGIEDLGQQMSNFMSSFAAFVEQVKMVDDSVFNKTTIVADMIGVIANIKYGDAPEMLTFGSALPAFGECIVAYYNSISTIEEYAKGNSITKAFSDLVSSLPADFSVMDTINTATFALSMSALGSGITSYYSAISSVKMDEATMSSAIENTKKVVSMIKEIPRTGGLIQDIIGTAEPSVFSNQMFYLGWGIRRFYKAAIDEGIDYGNLDGAIEATKKVITAIDDIPLTGGKVQWLIGQKNIGEFAANLYSLGVGTRNFYNAVTTGGSIDKDPMINAAEGLKSIVESVNQIDETGSIFTFLTGEKDISGFAGQLQNLGQGVADFYREVAGAGVFVDGTMTTTGFDKLTEFIELIQTLDTAIKDAQKTVKDQATILINVLKTTVRERYTDMKEAGEHIMTGFIKGIEGKQSEAETSMITFADGVVQAAEASLDEHSPSKVFQRIGEFVVKGFCNGVKATQSEANDGMVKMGVGILRATQKYFQIHSPSALMKNEVGVWIVRGIAEGITSDMSAEEAAEKKGENIKKAFQAGMDRVQLDLKTNDLEYQLWQAMNPNASEKDALKQQQENLVKKLELQAEAVNIANAEYVTASKSLGENAAKTQELYNEYTDQKIQFVETANTLIDLLGNSEAQQTARMVYFAQELAANQENLLKAGFTMDQIKSAIAERTGYDLNGAAESVQAEFKDLDSIIKKYLVEADVTIQQSVATSVSKGFSAGSTQAAVANTESAQGVVDQYFQDMTDSVQNIDPSTVATAVSDKTKEIFEGSKMAELEKYIDSAGKKIDGITQELFQSSNDSIRLDRSSRSSSADMYQNGVWLVQELANGITESSPLANSSITNLVNGMGESYRSAITSMLDGMSAQLTGEQSSIANIMVLFVDGILSIINSKQTTFYTSGNNLTKQLCEGLSNGFTTYFQMVTKAVTDGLTKLENDVKMRAESIAKAANQALTAASKADTVFASGGGGSGKLLPVFYAQPGEIVGENPYAGNWFAAHHSYTSKLASATGTTIGSASSGASFGSHAVGAGSTVVNFTQNNTSPRALSTPTLYRYGRNAASQLATSINSSKTSGGYSSGSKMSGGRKR